MFASFEYFKSKLIEKTGCDVLKLRKQQKRATKTATPTPAGPAPQREESNASIDSGSNGATGGANGVQGLEDGSASPTTAIKLNDENNQLSITSGTSGISERSEACNGVTLKLQEGGASFASAVSGTDSVKGILKTSGPHSGYQCLQIDNKVHHIILDCSVWAFVDDTAVKLLTEVISEFLVLCVQ